MHIRVQIEDPLSDDAKALMESLSEILKSITGSSGKSSFNIDDLKHPDSFFVMARNESNEALGCGSVRQMEEGPGEIKRMYSKVPGVGTEILKAIENQAGRLGYKVLQLETRKVNTKAVQFYLKHGYQIIDSYGKYVGRKEALCFAKTLV